MKSVFALVTVWALVAPAPAGAAPRLADLNIPGDPEFVKVARDVIDVVFAVDPSVAANAGLFDDAVRVPSFKPKQVKALVARLDRDLAAMQKMPWRSWPVDRQIDFRWVYAQAESARRYLTTERLFVHRPAAWFEPLAGVLIAFASYAPDETTRPARVWALVPGMLKEMRTVSSRPTRRDVETGRQVLQALIAMAEQQKATDAVAAMKKYDTELATLKPKREFEVIGAESYAWRLSRVLLLNQTPDELLAAAQKKIAEIDAELATLKPKLSTPKEPTKEQKARAAAFTRETLLGQYDAISESLRKATVAAGFVTIPEWVGPIKARETPDAMVPLTGDGGSMNPPPPHVDTNIGYWNVERFRGDWPLEKKLASITLGDAWLKNWMGPYAAHEGFPGHHLQLAIAQKNPNPIRNILPDAVQNEGWGLYAEEELYRHGGMGKALETRHSILRSWRYRAARVVYDVNIETGRWDLQRGADFKDRAEPGKGEVDEDILRAIQWPTQLISYFTGKEQITALREEYKKKMGAKYSDRAFHDAFLAEGSIPVSLIRAKLLGEPVPDL